MRTCFIAAVLGAALSSIACGGGTDASEPTAQIGSAIIDGTDSAADDDAVIAIGIHNSAGDLTERCSGSLVAPNVVLTARHCVSVVEGADIICDAMGNALSSGMILSDRPASELRIYVGATAGVTLDSEPKAQTPKEAAHGVQIVTDGSKVTCNHDVALIVLDHDVVGTYAPLHYDTLANRDLVTAIGFGLIGTGQYPDTRQKRDVLVADIGPYTATPSIAVGDAELFVGPSACPGDSGGPLMNANHAVAAVDSRGGGGTGTNAASSCEGKGAYSAYSAIGPHRALIEQAFAAAGKTPWLEGEPNPFTVAASAPPDDASSSTDPAPATTETKSGCSTSTRGANSSAWALIGVLALALTARRRHAG